jgi:hypothetical protein
MIRTPHIPHSLRPGIPVALIVVTIGSAALFAVIFAAFGASSSSDSPAAASTLGAADVQLPPTLQPATITYEVSRVDELGEHASVLELTFVGPSEWKTTLVDSSNEREIGSTRSYDGSKVATFDASTGIVRESELRNLTPGDGFFHPQLEFATFAGDQLSLLEAAEQLGFTASGLSVDLLSSSLSPQGTLSLTRVTADAEVGEEVVETYTYDIKTGFLLSRVTTINGKMLESFVATDISLQ